MDSGVQFRNTEEGPLLTIGTNLAVAVLIGTASDRAELGLAVTESGRQDSNLRPSAPKAPALPSCATPRWADHRGQRLGLQSVQAATTLPWRSPTRQAA